MKLRFLLLLFNLFLLANVNIQAHENFPKIPDFGGEDYVINSEIVDDTIYIKLFAKLDASQYELSEQKVADQYLDFNNWHNYFENDTSVMTIYKSKRLPDIVEDGKTMIPHFSHYYSKISGVPFGYATVREVAYYWEVESSGDILKTIKFRDARGDQFSAEQLGEDKDYKKATGFTSKEGFFHIKKETIDNEEMFIVYAYLEIVPDTIFGPDAAEDTVKQNIIETFKKVYDLN